MVRSQSLPDSSIAQRINQFETIENHQLAPRYFAKLTALGRRLQRKDTARVTYTGVIIDDRGQRQVEIVLQNPGSVRITEAGTVNRVTSFNGERVNNTSGALEDDAARLLVTFATDMPEAIFQQLAAGEAVRPLSSRTLLTGPAAVARPPEYLDVYQMLPRSAAKLAISGAATSKTFAFDSTTGFLRFVSYRSAAGVPITTQFEEWKSTGGEAFPSTIRRLETGREVFRITLQSLSLGTSFANGIF